MTDHQSPRKALGAAVMGNVIEWFDYGIYSYAAATIGMKFFPAHSTTAAALSSFAVLALSFFMRPIGGLVIGSAGDRHGRRGMLMLTIGLMTLGTVLIGVLPTYATIGIAAPILLICARLIQGFSAGGEYGGANTFMAESAPMERRGLFGSLLESGVLVGYMGGATVVVATSSLMSDANWEEWGWRIPFLVSLPLGLLALVLRRNLHDTPVFQNMQNAGEIARHPIADTFKVGKRAFTITILAIALGNGAYYIALTYMPTYLESELGISSGSALALGIVMMGVMMVLNPLFGRLGDRIGRRPMLAVSCALYIVLSVPLVALVNTDSIVLVGLAMMCFGAFLTPFTSQAAATFPVLFPRSVRYTGFTFAYNLSTAVFGGTAPLIVGSLLALTGNSFVIAFYLIACAVVAGIGVWMMPETRDLTADHQSSLPRVHEPAEATTGQVPAQPL
ncbi:MFS transporter [Rhodococcus jostii]|uniref:MFS transporter n=1 Tax=Rhodococcus jostii TaxID=132919 RepID=UPI0002FA070A|nr:MFS transporter [Rhodococcus jostii]